LGLAVPDQEHHLARWQEMLSEGISPLEPSARAVGPVATRWRVRVNVDGIV